MDVMHELQGQVFEWDTEKATSNLRKHHVSFERACEVFFDPFVRLVDASDNQESREAALGLTEDWALLFVVHIVRNQGSMSPSDSEREQALLAIHGNTIRIISARPATPSERRDYEHE